jgi:release factor glutamine methyltransferase
MNLLQAQQQLRQQLGDRYDHRELATIADWVMEKVTGMKKIDLILRKNEPLPKPAAEQLTKYTAELLRHRPVQYVLEESWFCGLKLYVDEAVLIPRPETEELVEWVAEEAASFMHQASSQVPPAHNPAGIAAPATASEPSSTILDVGTGSGCIAIALYKKLAGPPARALAISPPAVYACDTSDKALAIAIQNAAAHGAPIRFLRIDFLDSGQWNDLPEIQTIVSNPPYIPLSEKSSMAPHVVDFEPDLALFVADADPLIFYRALANFAKEKLLPGGSLFVEIHETLGPQVMQLFAGEGFPHLTLKKDLQGRDRMIKATR